MAVSGAVRVKLALFGIICFVLWQALRTVPSASSLSDEGGEVKPGAVAGALEERGSLAAVKTAVYYEALCPDSRSFITKQLLPAYERAPHIISPELVPYGKAQTLKLPDGTYRFTCQHGPLECQGNKIHACVVQKVKNVETQLKYVACMINDNMQPETIGEKCAQTFGVPWEPIEKCARGEEGDQLLKSFGDRTLSLVPQVSFIPTVTLNGKQDNQAAILKNLLEVVCNSYRPHRPQGCS